MDHNVAFDLTYILLGVHLSVVFEIVEKFGILRINLLLLPFDVVDALRDDLPMQTEQHTISIFLIFDLPRLYRRRLFEFKEGLLVARQLTHSFLLLQNFGLVLLLHVGHLVIEARLKLRIHIFSLLLIHLQLGIVLRNCVRFLVYLPLEGPRNFEHVFVMVLDIFPRPLNIPLQILQPKHLLLQMNVQLGDLFGLLALFGGDLVSFAVRHISFFLSFFVFSLSVCFCSTTYDYINKCSLKLVSPTLLIPLNYLIYQL